MGRPFIDETGNKYGKLTVIRFTKFDIRHNAWFLCKCECGNEIEIRGYCLRRGDNVACGCSQGLKNGEVHPLFVDKTGMRFGKLVVIRLVGTKNKQSMWECRCDCRNATTLSSGHLNKNGTKSCGCDKKLKEGEGCFNLLFAHYKRQAKKRNLSWSVSKEMFRKLTKENCHYCGTKPSSIRKNKRSNGDYIYNGLDRIDSSKGHTIDNVVPCCGICNWMKRDLNVEDFKNRILSVYEHWAKHECLKLTNDN